MPVIAITGLPGAGSTTIAEELSKELGLRHYSVGREFKKLGSGMGESNQALKALNAEGKEVHENLDEKQKRLAREGNIVIDGKISVRMLKDLADLKVWVECPIGIRAERTAKRDKISAQEAEETVKKREEKEKEVWERIYGFDYKEQKNEADIIIDSSNHTISEMVRLIKDKLNQ